MTAPAFLYETALLTTHNHLREGEPAALPLPPEIELQARWFSGEFGNQWVTEDGCSVEILDFGEWNREPGPDFQGVTLRFDGGDSIKGAVELDLDPRDWERHGHARNPTFDDTVLHLFCRRISNRAFARTSRHRAVPQVFLAVPATPPAPSRSPKMVTPVLDDPQQAATVLEAAAQFRLRRKAATFQRLTQAHGPDEALFQAIAGALGYKNNKTPFSILAQRARCARAQTDRGEALLFGLAGFLEVREPVGADAEARAYLRRLWDQWWDLRGGMERLILPATAWRFGGSRPANHPHRRAAALAVIAQHWNTIRTAVDRGDSRSFRHAMENLSHPFWNRRLTLDAPPCSRERALVGSERLTDLLINIFYPAAWRHHPALWDEFLRLPGPTPNRRVRQFASRLLTAAVATSGFLHRAACQQGLLQYGADLEQSDSPAGFLTTLLNPRSTPAPPAVNDAVFQPGSWI